MKIYGKGDILTLEDGSELLLLEEISSEINEEGELVKDFFACTIRHNEETDSDEFAGENYVVSMFAKDQDTYIKIKEELF